MAHRIRSAFRRRGQLQGRLARAQQAQETAAAAVQAAQRAYDAAVSRVESIQDKIIHEEQVCSELAAVVAVGRWSADTDEPNPLSLDIPRLLRVAEKVGTHRATAVVCNLVQPLEAAGAELTSLLDETGSQASKDGSWAGQLDMGLDAASDEGVEWEARRPRAPGRRARRSTMFSTRAFLAPASLPFVEFMPWRGAASQGGA